MINAYIMLDAELLILRERYIPGVGNDFSRGVQGVDLVLEFMGVSGGGFLDLKIDQNSNFSLF